MAETPNYSSWSRAKLVERVAQLEQELKDKTGSFQEPKAEQASGGKRQRPNREFDASRYSTRLIALKLAYLGKRYNGFEHHANNPTPLSTVEEELWRAFTRARLIFPTKKENKGGGGGGGNGEGEGDDLLSPDGEISWEGCEYSKCGRTDKGVSAFGQVIGIRVRSNRPLRRGKSAAKHKGSMTENGGSEVSNGTTDSQVDSSDAASAAPLESSASKKHTPMEGELDEHDEEINDDEEIPEFDPIADELPYPALLNRLLPPDIRILAWCPSPPPDFSARFSCRERRYKYFFTQPAFHPVPHQLEVPPYFPPTTTTTSTTTAPQKSGRRAATPLKEGWLDVEAMRVAARSFVGEHDFRNFCKVDGGKQITNFERTMFHADIEPVAGGDSTGALAYLDAGHFAPDLSSSGRDDGPRDGGAPATPGPQVWTFTLHGSAFLWHQVRHMVAVLFLVGQGLEDPSIVAELLDVRSNPRRPAYEMATDTALVLWDCVFPDADDAQREDALRWHYVGDGKRGGPAKYGSSLLVDGLWKMWRETKVDEVLAGSLLGLVASQGEEASKLEANPDRKGAKSQKVFDGGNAARLQGTYIPVMKKKRLDDVETINSRYAARKKADEGQGKISSGVRNA